MIESLGGALEAVGKQLENQTPSFWEKIESSSNVEQPASVKEAKAANDFWKGLESGECPGVQEAGHTEKSGVENRESENTQKNQDGKHCPIEGHGGHWDGERGNSKWIPDKDHVPQKQNPEQQSWGKILNEYGIDNVPFKDGDPNFGEVSKGNVEIEDFSADRSDNFDKADIELAKQRGCTPEEVAKWRKENGYTWHECRDMKTMQKVPSKVHNNIPHSGGVSEAKKESGEPL